MMWLRMMLGVACGLALTAAVVTAQPTSGEHLEAVTLHDFGSDEAALLALPAQPPKAAALLLPDALGSRDMVQQRCLLLARMGYLALALDFYDGQEAPDAAESDRLSGRVDGQRARQAIQSALRLLLDSPRYQCPRVLVAVWGPHIAHLASALDAEPDRVPRVALVTAVEARSAEIQLLQRAQLPSQFILCQEITPGISFEARNTGIRPYNFFDAPRGFMFHASNPPAAVEAWTLMLDAWARRLEGQSVADAQILAPDPPPPSASSGTTESKPRPLHPRLRR
jgi:hypothetical protein